MKSLLLSAGVVFILVVGILADGQIDLADEARVAPYVPGEVLVKFKLGVNSGERSEVISDLQATHLRTFRSGLQHWRLRESDNVGRAGDQSYYVDDFSGTSSAAPHVAGVAGLVYSKNPGMPAEIAKKRILDNVDAASGLVGVTVTEGRLNAYAPLLNFDSNAPAAISNLSGTGSGNGSISIQWSSTGDDGASGSAILYEVRTSTSTISSGNWLVADRAFNEPTPDPNSGVTESMTVANLAAGTAYYVAVRAFDEWGNGPLSNVIQCRSRDACQSSFCKASGEVFKRCTFNNTYGSGCNGCCQYTCVIDETCEEADPCPSNACSSACN